MKIPRKITPDNIKDSVVQIVFNPACPPELVIGRFENRLEHLFEFKGGTPPSKQVFKLPDGNELNFGQLQGGFFLDKNESVKVTVNPGVLVFNSFKNYPGWEIMFPVVAETIGVMFKEGIIENVPRIGVRYISQFENVAIFEKLKMSFELAISNKAHNTTQVRSEYDEEDYKIILSLLNNFKRVEGAKQHDFSMVDIDVIKLYRPFLSEAAGAIENIDKAHFKQKSIFFSLISDEFLKTLNPEY